MGLLFRAFEKKEPEMKRLFEYNQSELRKQINNLRDKIYDYRNETGLKLILEVLQLARNIQVLEINMAKSQDYNRGRLTAMSDLISYIESAIAIRKTAAKEGSEPKETLTVFKPRKSNVAGASI